MSLKLGLPNKIRRSRAGGAVPILLDQSFASGATAAYSLRLLRAKHSGGLVRVRADDSGTDKGEADVLPLLQPDGSKIITLDSPIENLSGTPFSGDGYVLADLVDSGGANYDGLTSKWYDQSGNSNDASQSNASEQPQIVNAGSVIQENGRPAIQLSGGNNFLSAKTISPAIRTAFTIRRFTVSPSNSDSPNGWIWNQTVIADSNRFGSFGRDGSDEIIPIIKSDGQTTNIRGGPLTDISESKLQVDIANENNELNLYINGSSSLFSTSFPSISHSGGTFFINEFDGSGNFGMEGNIQEAIFYASDQSSNRAEIESNINNHFSIF